MDEMKILGYIAKEIDKLRADQVTALVSGRAADHAEYRHACGVIRGLSLAETILNDLVQRLEKNDE